MRSLEELGEFYESELVRDLEPLEEKRKGIVNKLSIVGVILGVVLLVTILCLLTSFGGHPVFFIAPTVICILIGVGVYRLLKPGYVIEFKQLVIRRIVKFIEEGLNYRHSGRIEKGIYMASQIFKRRPDRYRGDDLVTGKIGKTKIEFSEIHSEYETHDKHGTHWHTIFKGLFFVGDFNKHFTCRMVVLPDRAERLFGHVGKILQSWNIVREQLVKLEDPEFEKSFVVYGNDQIQARYILSPSLMKRIVEFKKKTKRELYLSFQLSKIFVAIRYTKDMFEPKVFRSVLDFGPIQEYFEDLQLAMGIAEDLDLNTRIWSKE